MKKASALIKITSVLVALFIINFLAVRHPFRIDLTDSGIYTLSTSTKSILSSLPDVITAQVYFSGNLPPAMQTLKQSVEDMLSEFLGTAGKNFQIQFIDPSTSPAEEQRAAMLGIPPVQLNVIDKDKQEVAKIYLGIAVLYGDKQQVIPVVRSAVNLEYDLAEAIVKLTSPSMPKMGVLEVGENPASATPQFSYVREGVSRRYELVKIDAKNLKDLTTSKIAALMIISPRNVGTEAIRAIQSYISEGGRIALFADKVEITDQLELKPVTSDLLDALSKYGITVEPFLLLDKSGAMASFSGGPVTYHIPYAFWPQVGKSQFNQREPLSSDLEAAVFPWTSPLKLSPPVGAEDSPVAFSSAESCSVDTANLQLDPESAVGALLACAKEPQIIAGIVRGPLGGEGFPNAEIFVTGSSRWFSNPYLENFPENAALFENIIDSLALQQQLIGIRSKDVSSRPIAVISNAQRNIVKYSNILAGPAAVLMAALLLGIYRRKKRASIRARFNA